jgi:hypothetical protein
MISCPKQFMHHDQRLFNYVMFNMTTKSIINGFINLRISFSDIIVDVVVFGHLAPKCV